MASPFANMEVVDLEKKSIEDTSEIYNTNDQTAELDINGEMTEDAVDQFQQNHWQFSDEGMNAQEC